MNDQKGVITNEYTEFCSLNQLRVYKVINFSMSGFYFHQQFAPIRSNDNIRPYRMGSVYNNRFVCLASGCSIELHQLVSSGLIFHSRYQFHCNIAKIQILPSRHHQSDFIWILDELGRYACWRPTEGYQLVENIILEEKVKEELQDVLRKENAITFSGANYQFEENDTQGTIFYLIRSKFVLLHFTINQQGMFINQARVLRYNFPYQTVRHVGWVSWTAMFLLGVIEETEEGKTILKVHDLQLGLGICSQSMEWQLQKNNLLQFYPGQNDDLLVLTFNEVSLYQYKMHNPACNYRTRGNYGQGCSLGQGFYAHIGEQLTIFSRHKLKTYGQLKFEEEALMKESGLVACMYLGEILNHGKAIALTTIDRGLYLLIVYPNEWKMFKKEHSLNDIVSLLPVSKDVLVVVSGSPKQQVSLLQWKYPLTLLMEQQFQFVVEDLIAVLGGSYIILLCKEINAVFRLKGQGYQFYFSLPHELILSASEKFAVTEKGLYQIDYQSQTYSQVIKTNLVLCQITTECIYYLDEQEYLWSYSDYGSKVLIAKDRGGDYCWGVIQSLSTLISASLDSQHCLDLINTEGEKRKVAIKGHTLISSLSSVVSIKGREALRLSDLERYHILVGYVDGTIHLHSQLYGLLHAFEHLGASLIRFTNISEQSLIVSSGCRQYWMDCNQDCRSMNEILLSAGQKYISGMAYLSKSEQIICIEHQQFNANRFIRAFKVEKTLFSSIGSNRVATLSRICQLQNQIPFILLLQQRLFVAAANSLIVYSLRTKRQTNYYHHQLAQIISLKTVDLGLLLCGVTSDEKEVILILSQSLQLICRFTMNTKKYLKSVETIAGSNQFFVRYDTFVALYKITAGLQLTQLLGSNINMQGHTLDIDAQSKTLLINDPFRYLALFQYQHSISFKASYMPAILIQNVFFFGDGILVCDDRGQITVLKQHHDSLFPNKVSFIKTGTLNLGEAITVLSKFGERIYYGTVSGKIGYLTAIDKDQYDILHKLQEESILALRQSHRFDYSQWRSRIPSNQRIIDASLLHYHITEDIVAVKQELGETKLFRVMALFQS